MLTHSLIVAGAFCALAVFNFTASRIIRRNRKWHAASGCRCRACQRRIERFCCN